MADGGVRSLAPNRPRIISRHTLDRSDGDPPLDHPDGDPTSSGTSTPDRKGLDIEAILNDLYASEINASISWIWGWRLSSDPWSAADRGIRTSDDPRCRLVAQGQKPPSIPG